MTPEWSILGLILSSTVVVELIRLATAGITKRRRAKGKERTVLEVALSSRSRWITHAQHLRALWHKTPRPELPAEPDDPWPPKEKE